MPNNKSIEKNYIYNFDNLFSTLLNLKYWIIGLSSFTTILIIVFATTKTPVYQASSNIIVGSYEVLNLDCNKNRIRMIDYCQQTFKKNALFMDSHVIEDNINSFAGNNLSNQILITNNQDNTLTLFSIAGSIEEAKISIQKLNKYLSQLNLKNIEALENQWVSRIRKLEQKVSNLVNWELNPIQKANDYQLFKLDKSIAYNQAKVKDIQSQQNILNKNLVNTVSTSLSNRIIELSQEIETIKNFGLPKLLSQIKIAKEIYQDTIFKIDLFKVQDKASVKSQIDYIKNFELPFYATKINNLRDQLIKNDSLLRNINLNEINQTNFQDSNQINMISIRTGESQYLRDIVSSLTDQILNLELENENLLIKYKKLLEVKEAQESEKFYVFSESGISSDAFRTNQVFLQNLNGFFSESIDKLQDLESDHESLLKKQVSLKKSLALLKNYKEKWFESETNNFDTSNILGILSIDELAFLSITTNGELIFDFENKINALESEKTITENLVSSLSNEKYSHINVTIPRNELELYAINTEVDNLQMVIDSYKDLLAAKNYINMAFIGEIYAPKKQLTPNIAKYAAFGFLASLSLFLFLFSLLSLISPKKKNV